MNLLADMGVQPGDAAGRPGRRRPQSTDTTAPTSTITSPASGATVPERHAGHDHRHRDRRRRRRRSAASRSRSTAARPGTRRPGATTWTYTWTPGGDRHARRSRAARSTTAATSRRPGAQVTRQRRPSRPCPCSIWDNSVTRLPRTRDHQRDRARREVPLRRRRLHHRRSASTRPPEHRHPRRAPVDGSGTQLAPATFTGETRHRLAAGQLRQPGADHRQHDLRRLVSRPERPLRRRLRLLRHQSASTTRPLHALQGWTGRAERRLQVRPVRVALPDGGPNSFESANYWVDVVFETTLVPDTTPPTVVSRVPGAGATGVAGTTNRDARPSARR